MPMPNPLQHGLGQGSQPVHPFLQQENVVYGIGADSARHQQSRAEQDSVLSEALKSTQENAPIAWELDDDALESDASMADTDDERSHIDALALARAEKRPVARFSDNRSSTEDEQGTILTQYLEMPHRAIFRNPELVQAYQHFIYNTAPIISLYERPSFHRRNEPAVSSLWSSKQAIPRV